MKKQMEVEEVESIIELIFGSIIFFAGVLSAVYLILLLGLSNGN